MVLSLSARLLHAVLCYLTGFSQYWVKYQREKGVSNTSYLTSRVCGCALSARSAP
jgi:hypothetical protein